MIMMMVMMMMMMIMFSAAPLAVQQSVCEGWRDFTEEEPVRVAVGNYNINGGKHFRSVAFKDVSLQDWLLFDKTDLGRKDMGSPSDVIIILSSDAEQPDKEGRLLRRWV